jgi:hypothetical protein
MLSVTNKPFKVGVAMIKVVMLSVIMMNVVASILRIIIYSVFL